MLWWLLQTWMLNIMPSNVHSILWFFEIMIMLHSMSVERANCPRWHVQTLAPHFINNDYVTAEPICSTAHVYQEVLPWSQATLCCMHKLHLESSGIYYCIMAMSDGSATRGQNIVCLLLKLLQQPRENKRVCSSYGSLSFLPASHLCRAYPGFSKQCEQQDNWHHKQDQWYSV